MAKYYSDDANIKLLLQLKKKHHTPLQNTVFISLHSG